MPPTLSPDSYLRVLRIGEQADQGPPALPDAVTVVRDVGRDVAQIRGELASGRVVLAVAVDCELFTEAEVSRIIEWVRRATDRKRGRADLRIAR